MIKSFRIINHLNESITIDIRKPEVTGFLISSVTGLTPPKSEILTSELPSYDGATYSGYHIGTRNIVFNIIFFMDNTKKETIEELRWKCYKYFPLRRKIRVYVTNDSGMYHIDGYVESNEINIFSKNEAAQISILCPDPYFIKDNTVEYTYVSNITPNFQFPVSFEVTEVPKASGQTQPGFEVIEDSKGNRYSLYQGAYTVTPKVTAQSLDTDYAYLTKDVDVKAIPITKTSNTAGGLTAKIGG